MKSWQFCSSTVERLFIYFNVKLRSSLLATRTTSFLKKWWQLLLQTVYYSAFISLHSVHNRRPIEYRPIALTLHLLSVFTYILTYLLSVLIVQVLHHFTISFMYYQNWWIEDLHKTDRITSYHVQVIRGMQVEWTELSSNVIMRVESRVCSLSSLHLRPSISSV